MESLVKYLSCGKISVRGDIVDFQVIKLTDITEKIIPFFGKYPILGVKQENYEDFCKVAELMKEDAHLTKEGLKLISKIKYGMNTYRESTSVS
jgi:hypothetical protein